MLKIPTNASGSFVVVDAEPLLAVRPVVRILVHEHRARLRERERHHRERDPADAQRDGAEHERRRRSASSAVKSSACAKLQCQSVIAMFVMYDADRDVERVPERQQPREAEQQVVA